MYTNTGTQAYRQPLPSKVNLPTLPPLGRVVLVQGISLLITIALGIALYMRFISTGLGSPMLIILASLLAGPVYAINIPYLLKYMAICEGIKRRTGSELERFIHSGDRQGLQEQNGNFLTMRYLFLQNTHQGRSFLLSKGILTISFFTPIFPITYYLVLYEITRMLNENEDLVRSVDPLMPGNKTEYLVPSRLSPSVSLRIPGFFIILAAISVITFGMTFFIFSVGFLALFWTVMIHLKLRGYYRSPPPMKSYFNGPLTAAFICFGATAGFLASISNTYYMAYIIPVAVVSPTLFVIILVSVIAPIVEEILKPAGLFAFADDGGKTMPLFYWALYGMFAGLGFASLENYIYFQRFLVDYTLTESLQILSIRLLFPVHMLGSALVGIGIGLYRIKKGLVYLVIFTLLGILVHGAYNFIMVMGAI